VTNRHAQGRSITPANCRWHGSGRAALSDADANLSWRGVPGPQMVPNGVNGLPDRTVGRTLTDPPSRSAGHQRPSGGAQLHPDQTHVTY
jgi:hypothetical protein